MKFFTRSPVFSLPRSAGSRIDAAVNCLVTDASLVTDAGVVTDLRRNLVAGELAT
jgi:hypothetical protein